MAPLDGGSCKFVFFFFSTDQHNTRVRRGCVLRYFWPQVQWGHPSVQSGKKAPNEHPAYVGPPTTLTFQKQQKVLCRVFDNWVGYVKSGEHTRANFLPYSYTE